MFIDEQVEEWTKDIEALVEIARSEPQLAYCAYIFGTSKRWQFVCRTTPGVGIHLQKLEDLIRSKLIPAIVGIEFISDEMRKIFSLPARLGGLGFLNPVIEADFDYEDSLAVTAQLTRAIYNQDSAYVEDSTVQAEAMKALAARKNERYQLFDIELKENISSKLYKLIKLSSEKGASNWLTSLTLMEFGFRLNKQEFTDAISMRYDLKLKEVPTRCACGDVFSINHCLSCKKGGYIHLRHNSVRDTVSDLLSGVCHDVVKEPHLLPVRGEKILSKNQSDGARADVSALGLWSPFSRAFLDIMVFNPLAKTNWAKDISDMYSSNEKKKRDDYNDRIIQIEKGTFTPLVFSCTGGAAPEAEKFIKQLAKKIALKRQEEYCNVVSFIRRRIRFDILKSCAIAFRGYRKPTLGVAHVSGLDYGVQSFDG